MKINSRFIRNLSLYYCHEKQHKYVRKYNYI